jgi:hypothetical protein
MNLAFSACLPRLLLFAESIPLQDRTRAGDVQRATWSVIWHKIRYLDE